MLEPSLAATYQLKPLEDSMAMNVLIPESYKPHLDSDQLLVVFSDVFAETTPTRACSSAFCRIHKA